MSVVIVTGGSRGIGLATAQLFAERGCQVAITYRRHQQQAEDALHVLGDRSMALRADAQSPQAMAEAIRLVTDRWGPVDVAIHNAASGVARPLADVTRHHWDHTMGINAFGLVSLAQAVLPHFSQKGGSIIGVSSLGSVRAFENYGLVGASKAALESLARHLARECGPKKIRVNIISAGPVDTEALRHFPNREDLLNEFIERNPLHQALTPNDVAEAVWFLAQQPMINGQTLVVDGGYLAMA